MKKQKTNKEESRGLGIAGMVLGIVSVVLSLPLITLPFVYPMAVVGLILSIYQMKKLITGQAITGLVTNLVIVIPGTLFYIYLFALFL